MTLMGAMACIYGVISELFSFRSFFAFNIQRWPLWNGAMVFCARIGRVFCIVEIADENGLDPTVVWKSDRKAPLDLPRLLAGECIG
jgi:hypothetical protein